MGMKTRSKRKVMPKRISRSRKPREKRPKRTSEKLSTCRKNSPRKPSIKSNLFKNIGQEELVEMINYIKGQLQMIRALTIMEPKLGEPLKSNSEFLETQLQICRGELAAIRMRKFRKRLCAKRPKLKKRKVRKAKRKRKRRGSSAGRISKSSEMRLTLTNRFQSLTFDFIEDDIAESEL